MTKYVQPSAPVLRFCSKCGERLTQSNKSVPPRCFNTAVCNSRAKAKFEERVRIAAVDLSPRSLFKEGLNFERIVDVICEHFCYDNTKRKIFLGRESVKGYLRPRYILIYLLVNDLGLSKEEAGGCIDRDRKTASLAYITVTTDLAAYEQDLEAIRFILQTKKIKQPA